MAPPRKKQKQRGRRKLLPLSNDVVGRVLDQLSLRDILNVSQVNTQLRRIAHSHVAATLDRIITLHGFDTAALLGLLHENGSIISGSVVLMLLNPWTFVARDLDIYVPASRGDSMRNTLTTDHGLTVVYDSARDAARNPYASLPDVTTVLTLRDPAKRILGRSVNIIVSSTEDPFAPICHFHSTAVMNFISASEVYCAYPALTFTFKNVINSILYHSPETNTERFDLCLTKYACRGYQFQAEVFQWPEHDGHVCGADPSCPRTRRNTRDGNGFRYYLHNRAVQDMNQVTLIEGLVGTPWHLA